MIGPPRPPPRPSARAETDEDGGMVGPPQPPAAKEADEEYEDEDEDEEDDDDMEDDFESFNRIPLSNEIVLRGHTKVSMSNVLVSSPSFFLELLKLMWPYR